MSRPFRPHSINQHGMIPTIPLYTYIRILRIPKRRPQTCHPVYWNLWSKLRIRLIGKPTIVGSEEEKLVRAMPKAGFYAVKVGRKPGIYDTWGETTAQVEGYPNAKHKKFKSRIEAEAYLASVTSHPAPTTTNAIAGPSRSSQASSVSDKSHTPAIGNGNGKAREDSPISSIPLAELPAELQKIAEKGYMFSRSSHDPKGKARLVVYCDGSGLSNGKMGARAGAGVWWGGRGEAAEKNTSERVPGEPQTNNRGELLAIILAVEQCPYHDLPLEIRTDSSYAIKCMTVWLSGWLKNGFKPSKSGKSGKHKTQNDHDEEEGGVVKNVDMIKHLLVLLRRRGPVRFKWVPAHVGVEGNEAADKLAKLGAAKSDLPDRLDWLDPDGDDVPPTSSGPINIDFEDLPMTAEELAAFDIASYEEF